MDEYAPLRRAFKVTLASTSILVFLILFLWIGGIWTGDARLGWTGALFILPLVLSGAVTGATGFFLLDEDQPLFSSPEEPE